MAHSHGCVIALAQPSPKKQSALKIPQSILADQWIVVNRRLHQLTLARFPQA